MHDGITKRVAARDFICLVVLMSIFWATSYAHFEFVRTKDLYRAFCTHPQILLCLQLLLLFSVIGFARYRKLSLGWPIAFFSFAMLYVSFYTPAIVLAKNGVLSELKADPYFEFTQRSLVYFVSSTIQVLGYVFAWLSRARLLAKNRIGIDEEHSRVAKGTGRGQDGN